MGRGGGGSTTVVKKKRKKYIYKSKKKIRKRNMWKRRIDNDRLKRDRKLKQTAWRLCIFFFSFQTRHPGEFFFSFFFFYLVDRNNRHSVYHTKKNHKRNTIIQELFSVEGLLDIIGCIEYFINRHTCVMTSKERKQVCVCDRIKMFCALWKKNLQLIRQHLKCVYI